MGKMEEAKAYAVKLLKKNPEITLQEARAAGKSDGFTIYPAILSQARADLGITAKRGARRGKKKSRKKAARRRAAAPAAPRRRKAAAKRAAPAAEMSALSDFVDLAKRLESDVTSLRSALSKIRDIVNEI